MLRTSLLALLLLLVWGCENQRQALSRPGPDAAHAAVRADSLPVTTRRLQAGEGTDVLIAPLPDGRVVVTDWKGTGDLAIRDLRTGSLERLTRHNLARYDSGNAWFPSVSRDGKRVAYLWSSNKNDNEIRVVDVTGSGMRTILRFDGRAQWVDPQDWSPDGRWILANRTQSRSSTGELVLIPTDGAAPRVVKALGSRSTGRVNFSADGRFIVYDLPVSQESNRDRDLFTLDVRTGRETRLVEHPANDVVLGWAPDGRHVLFSSDRSGTPGAWLLPVADGKAAGAPVLVRPDLWNSLPGSFTPDGRYFYGVVAADRGLYTATLDPASGKATAAPVALTRPGVRPEFPRWSPDGRFLAYLVDRSPVSTPLENRVLAIHSLESGEVREFPLPRDFTAVHEWTRDGRGLLLRTQTRDGNQVSVARLDAQSGITEALFTLPAGWTVGGFRVRPDGMLVYVTGRPGDGKILQRQVVVRDLQTGTERSRCETQVGGPTTPAGFRAAVLSASGTMRAGIVATDTMEAAVAVEWHCSSRQPKVLARFPERLVRGGSTLSFSADERFVYFERGRPGSWGTNELWRVAVAGGAPEPVGVTMRGLAQHQIEPSGRRVAFLAGQREHELWVMENLFPAGAAAAKQRR